MQKEGARANVREDDDYTNVVIVKKKLFGNNSFYKNSSLFVIICCEEHTPKTDQREREREKESTFSPLSCLFPSLISPLLFFFLFFSVFLIP